MGIRLRNDSISSIFLLTEIIENFMKDNNINLIDITEKDEEIIQKKYDKIMDEFTHEINK